jgi:DNA-binding response OmpR family regulator
VRTRASQAIAAALRGDDTGVTRALGDDPAEERAGYHVELALAHLARGLVERRAGNAGAWTAARAAAARVLASADGDLLDSLLAVIDVEPGRAAPPVVIDTARHEVVAGARVLSLGTRPVLRKLLYALAERPAETLSKDDLTRAAWGQEYDPLRHDNPLFVNVSRLRQLLRDTGLSLDADNDRGGYRLTSRDQLVLRRPR